MLCLIIHSGYIDKTEKKNSEVLNPNVERSLLHFPSHFLPPCGISTAEQMQGPPVCSQESHWVPEEAQLPWDRAPVCSRESCYHHPNGFGNQLMAHQLNSFYSWHICLLPQLVSHAALHSVLGFAYAGFTQLQFNWLQWHYSWGWGGREIKASLLQDECRYGFTASS